MFASSVRASSGNRLAAALVVSLTLSGIASAANPTINVDLSKTEGPIRHVAAGLLWPFTTTDPPSSVLPTLYDPLNIQFLRCSTSPWILDAYLGRDPHATYITTLSDAWGFPNRGPYAPPPWTSASSPDWSSYESYLKTQIANVKAEGLTPIYDVWNEPNENGFFLDWLVDANGVPKYDGKVAWPDEGKQFYFELYKRTYKLVRQLHPEAAITGPSDGQSEPGAMQGVRDFKDFCVTNNCVPDYWNWHAGIDAFGDDLSEALSWNLNKGVLIPEYLGPDQSTRPGRVAWEMAIYESSQVIGCCKAQWSNRGQVRGTLNWAIFQDTDGKWKKHGIWWSYATYGAMTGDRVTCSTANDNLPRVNGIVAYNKKKRAVVGLLGNSRYDTDPYNRNETSKINGYQGNVDVNIQSVLPLGRTVRVVVEKLPSGITGFDPTDGVTPIAVEVPAPVLVSDTTVSTLSNKISFRINWADGYDAYRFTITAP